MDPAVLMPGAELGGFNILEQVHEGGMAVLYRVRKPGIELPLVMKVPKPAFGSHPACYVGFEMEQMILSSLSGPHVPRLIAKGDLDKDPFIVMEWIEGPLLADLAAKAPLPASEIARLVAPLAAAVHDLHRQNVIHLDLKPANVLYRPTGEAVLVDFGLARHAQLPDLVHEQFPVPVGTSEYISPEQVLGYRGDLRSDLFALGVIMYRLATAKAPFGAPTTRAGFRRRLYLDPVPPRRLNPEVPEWLQEIILHCLEVRAADRYATAAQLAHDLAHPAQVPITERGRRTGRAGLGKVLKRWAGRWREAPAPAPSPALQVAGAAHLLVAVDLEHRSEALAQALRDAVRRAVASEDGCRVSFATVQAPGPFSEEENRAIENSNHTRGLVQLRHWASPLGLPSERVRYHVLQGTDPAAAILGYATAHHVDHIIMGARGHSALRRFLGSVSTRVVAESVCTVTVVRPHGRQAF